MIVLSHIAPCLPFTFQYSLAMAASIVLRSRDLLAAIVAHQDGLSELLLGDAQPLHHCIAQGNAPLVEQWLRYEPTLVISSTLELAAASSQGAILRLLFQRFPQLATPKMMDLVAMSGDLPLLRWLHEAGVSCTTAAMDGAAMNGHLDIVIFLHEARSEGCTIVAATAAVVHGHADIVRFLLEHRSEGIDPWLRYAPPHAAYTTHCVIGTTHLEAVDLASTTTRLMEAARHAGLNRLTRALGLPALQHFYTRGYHKMTKRTLEIAIERHDDAMLQYVLDAIQQDELAPRSDKKTDWLPPQSAWSDCNAMDIAAFYGNMTALNLLQASRLRCTTARAITNASYNGHVDVLDWLYVHRNDGCADDTLPLAAMRGHLDAVRWLVEIYKLEPTNDTLASAAYSGNVALVRFLLELPQRRIEAVTSQCWTESDSMACMPTEPSHGGRYATGRAADWAAERGHLEILELLVAHGHTASVSAIYQAVDQGHAPIVQYLHQVHGQRCRLLHLLSACRLRHRDVVSYVLSHECLDLAHNRIEAISDMYEGAATSGDTVLLAIVHGVFAFDLPSVLPQYKQEQMMHEAASKGHLEMLRCLVATYGLTLSTKVAQVVLRSGDRKAKRWVRHLLPAMDDVVVATSGQSIHVPFGKHGADAF